MNRADEGDRVGARPWRAELREAAGYSLVVFATMRGALTLLGILGIALIPTEGQLIVEPGWHNLVRVWDRWDAEWFVRIATEGYQAENGTAAFFPLYPMLVKVVAAGVGGLHFGVALALSNLFAYFALVAVYLISRLEFGVPVARRAVLYLAIFPTALFLIAPYSESLFLFAVASSFLAARRGRWGWAAVAGAAASATRSIGLMIVPALLTEVVLQHIERDQAGRRNLRTTAWSALCSLAAAGGAFAYFLYWRIQADDWLVPLRSQSGWQREFTLLPEALWDGTRAAFQFVGAYSGGYHQVDWLLVALAIVCAGWVVLRVRISYVVFTLLSLLVPLVLIFPGRPFMSMPRFVLVIFPLYWAIARFSERFRAHTFVTAVFAGGLGVLTLLFVTNYFIF